METALMIVALIACVVFIVLAYESIGAVKSIKVFADKAGKNLDSITADIHAFKNRSIQTFDEVTVLNQRITIMVDEITELKSDISHSFKGIDQLTKSIDNTAKNLDEKSDMLFRMLAPIESLTNLVLAKVAGPVVNSINFVSAASKAVSVFSKVLFRKG